MKKIIVILMFFAVSCGTPPPDPVPTEEEVRIEMAEREDYWESQVEVVFERPANELDRATIYVLKVKDCEYIYFESRYVDAKDIFEHFEGCPNHQ